jgi:DNA-directed RNA polymerase specialized sigma24 family protein
VLIRRAVWRFVQKEHRYHVRTLPLDEIEADAGESTPACRASGPVDPVLLSPTLPDQLSHPFLADALRGLNPRNLTILQLYYWEGLTDREIADRLAAAPDAIRQQRHRILTALRRQARSQDWR